MRIFKYSIENYDLPTIELPIGAKVLSVINQQGVLCLWALIDEAAETEMRGIRMLTTGAYVEGMEDYEYVSTVLQLGGAFVIHVFIQST